MMRWRMDVGDKCRNDWIRMSESERDKNCVYKSLLFLSILMADITSTLKPISTFFFLFNFHSAHFLRHSLLSDLGSFHFAYSL